VKRVSIVCRNKPIFAQTIRKLSFLLSAAIAQFILLIGIKLKFGNSCRDVSIVISSEFWGFLHIFEYVWSVFEAFK